MFNVINDKNVGTNMFIFPRLMKITDLKIFHNQYILKSLSGLYSIFLVLGILGILLRYTS